MNNINEHKTAFFLRTFFEKNAKLEDRFEDKYGLFLLHFFEEMLMNSRFKTTLNFLFFTKKLT